MKNEEKTSTNVTVEPNNIHHVLLNLGVASHLSGYTYIVQSLELVLIDPDLLHHVTKGLYIVVAKKYGVKPANVERAIRLAISTTLTYGNMDFINSVFRNSVRPDKGAPTNTMFLSRLYYYLNGVK